MTFAARPYAAKRPAVRKRGSTLTFVERDVGDVLLAWDNEAFLAVNELGKGKFQIVGPSISILAAFQGGRAKK